MVQEVGLMARKVLDHGYVTYIEHWGSDERIIEAARMSTSQGFRGWEPRPCETCYQIPVKMPTCKTCKGSGMMEGDTKLLRYLWKNQHHTPFEMAGLTIEVQAPIFVFREWHRHRTQSYNELSGRYTELPDLFYVPSIERLMSGKQATTNKQGSTEGFTRWDAQTHLNTIYAATAYARDCYEMLLKDGVARELARLVVPVNQYSRMRASANLRNWLAFLTLRTADHAQWEIRQYATAVADIIEETFPRTFALWEETTSS